MRVQGLITTGTQVFSSTGRTAVLANLESPELRAAITQLYELLDQSVAPPEQARLLMLHAAQAFPESKLFRTAPASSPSVFITS